MSEFFIGIIFLIAGLLGAETLGEKFEYGCLIFIMVIIMIGVLFVSLLSLM